MSTANAQQNISNEIETKVQFTEAGTWVHWLNKNLTAFESYKEEFGTDLIELVAKQCTKAQCRLFWLPRDAVYLLALGLSDQEEDRETYGNDQINCVSCVAQKYFDDHQNCKFMQPLVEVTVEVDTNDVGNFGKDFTDAVSRAVMFVFAKNTLKGYRETSQLDNTESNMKMTSEAKEKTLVASVKIPFAAGCKATHIIQGETFGCGHVVARNGEYLVVEFPAVSRKLELAIATAGRFLLEFSET